MLYEIISKFELTCADIGYNDFVLVVTNVPHTVKHDQFYFNIENKTEKKCLEFDFRTNEELVLLKKEWKNGKKILYKTTQKPQQSVSYQLGESVF